MTANPTSVHADTLMKEVAKIFENASFHHIPVVDDDGTCIGVISKSDYYQLQDKFTLFGCGNAQEDNDRFFDSITAEEVITEKLVHLSINAKVKEAISIFLENKVHSIVIQENGVLRGILTPYDIIQEVEVLPCLELQTA